MPAIVGQSVSAARAAPAWQAAIAACSWYGPGLPWLSAAASASCPSAILARSQRPRSCSSSGDEVTAGVHPGRPAGVLQQHQRQQAERLRFVRHEPGEQSREPDRLGAQVRS